MDRTLLFLYLPCNFLSKAEQFEYCNVVNFGNQNSPFLVVFVVDCWSLQLSSCWVTFPNYPCTIFVFVVLCGHWSLCSIIPKNQQRGLKEISLNTWRQRKKKKILTWSLQIDSKLGHSFNTKPGCLQLCLRLSSCSCGVQKSAKGAGQRSSQIFFEQASGPRHVCWTVYSPVHAVALQSPCSPKNLPPQSPLSQASGLPRLSTSTISWPRWLRVVDAFKRFCHMSPEKLLQPNGSKTKVSFCADHEADQNA